MRYRPLGSSGLVVSVAGLGCNNFGRRLDVAATRAVVDAAIDAGITLLDTADTYGGAGRSEEILGEVLAGRRDQVVLATKFGNQGADMGYGPGGRRQGRPRLHPARRRAVAAPAAHRLHRPVPDAHAGPADPDRGDAEPRSASWSPRARSATSGTPTSPAGRSPTAAGAARELGTAPFISAQNHWSLLERAAEAEVVPACDALRARRAAVLPAGQRAAHRQGPARPRAGARAPGCTAGTSYITEDKLDKVEALAEWAEQHGRSLLEVAIGALAALPGCTSVIAGATSPEQVRANAAASDWVPERRRAGRDRQDRARRRRCQGDDPLTPRAACRRRGGDRSGGRRRLVQRRDVGPEPRGVGDARRVPALLVAADHADHLAVARRLPSRGSGTGRRWSRRCSRRSRTPSGAGACLVKARAWLRAGDRPAGGVGVADDLDLLGQPGAGRERLGPGRLLRCAWPGRPRSGTRSRRPGRGAVCHAPVGEGRRGRLQGPAGTCRCGSRARTPPTRPGSGCGPPCSARR